MKTNSRFPGCVASLTLGAILVSAANAQDIDLFLQSASDESGVAPNVLFVLDNSANWNATLYTNGKQISKKNVIHHALYSFMQSPDLANKVRVGMMNYSSSLGGKVIAAVDDLESSYQVTLSNKILGASIWSANKAYTAGQFVVPTSPNGLYYKVTSSGTSGPTEPVWPTSNNGTVSNGSVVFTNNGAVSAVEKVVSYNNAPVGTTMYEALRYFQGSAPVYGTADGDHDPAALSGGMYRSPALENHCAKNFVIYIANGRPDSGENNTAEAKLSSVGGKLSSDPIRLSPDNYQSNWADEFARFNAGTDLDTEYDGTQNLVTYVIDVVDPATATTTPEKAARAFLKSIADQGKGLYFTAKNVDELQAALAKIMDEIIAVNSVFASTTLPVSVNVRGTNLNQVYMGVFRPDENRKPYWLGNLKMYKLGYDSGANSVYLADKDGIRADSPVTGFIVSSANSFWTHSSTYWTFSPRGTPASPSDAPDGEVVEKGAIAQELRERTTARQIYTCIGCSNGSTLSQSFDTSIDPAKFGTGTTTTERDNIVNWVRGVDLFDENGNGSTSDVRANVHGDVLHSRPAVINFARGSEEDDVVAFYGSNDGIFRAIKGGKVATNGVNAGTELWGIVFEEFFPQLRTIYNNVVMGSASDKPIFADGTVGAYQGNGKAYIYVTMRRGGRFIYALDVSTPEAPKFMWKITASGSFSELGQTWSDPKIIRIEGYDNPVVVFGGGYDPAEDADLTSGTPNTMGRGIFFIDGVTGALLKSFGPADGIADCIPGRITAVDKTGNGRADRAYAADTGGNIWRIDMSSSNRAAWTISKFAALGSTGTRNRKFLYNPDVVFGQDFDTVLIGSGNREAPHETSVQNRFFMLKDTGSGTTIVRSQLYDATAYTDGIDMGLLESYRGWFINLDAGEKVVGNAVTLDGKTYFNTHLPRGSSSGYSCAPSLGTARAYVVNYLTSAGERFSEKPGGGFLPPPVPFVVNIPNDSGESDTLIGIISGTQLGQGERPQLNKRQRVFWYKENVD